MQWWHNWSTNLGWDNYLCRVCGFLSRYNFFSCGGWCLSFHWHALLCIFLHTDSEYTRFFPLLRLFGVFTTLIVTLLLSLTASANDGSVAMSLHSSANSNSAECLRSCFVEFASQPGRIIKFHFVHWSITRESLWPILDWISAWINRGFVEDQVLLVYLELQMRLDTIFLFKKFGLLSCAQFAIVVLEILNHALLLPDTCSVTHRQQLWLGTVLCGLC